MMSSFLEGLKYLSEIRGMYKVRMYRPNTEPTTPMQMQAHRLR